MPIDTDIILLQEAGEKIVTQAGPLLDPKEKVQKPKPPGYNQFTPSPYYRTQGRLFLFVRLLECALTLWYFVIVC